MILSTREDWPLIWCVLVMFISCCFLLGISTAAHNACCAQLPMYPRFWGNLPTPIVPRLGAAQHKATMSSRRIVSYFSVLLIQIQAAVVFISRPLDYATP
jgi:hypothetical protein